MASIFVQEGGSVDYVPATDVAAGDVVLQGDMVGIAKLDIKAGELGALAVTGVFDMPKTPSQPIAAGVWVFWDDTNLVVTTTQAGNKRFGKAVREAAAADATVRVRLIQ